MKIGSVVYNIDPGTNLPMDIPLTITGMQKSQVAVQAIIYKEGKTTHVTRMTPATWVQIENYPGTFRLYSFETPEMYQHLKNLELNSQVVS